MTPTKWTSCAVEGSPNPGTPPSAPTRHFHHRRVDRGLWVAPRIGKRNRGARSVFVTNEKGPGLVVPPRVLLTRAPSLHNDYALGLFNRLRAKLSALGGQQEATLADPEPILVGRLLEVHRAVRGLVVSFFPYRAEGRYLGRPQRRINLRNESHQTGRRKGDRVSTTTAAKPVELLPHTPNRSPDPRTMRVRRSLPVPKFPMLQWPVPHQHRRPIQCSLLPARAQHRSRRCACAGFSSPEGGNPFEGRLRADDLNERSWRFCLP